MCLGVSISESKRKGHFRASTLYWCSEITKGDIHCRNTHASSYTQSGHYTKYFKGQLWIIPAEKLVFLFLLLYVVTIGHFHSRHSVVLFFHLSFKLFFLSLSLSIAHLLRGCFVTGMCCDATRIKKNVIGESVLHFSVYQPPVIRTLHMKAMTDIKKKKKSSEMEDWVCLPPPLPFCLPSIPQKSA